MHSSLINWPITKNISHIWVNWHANMTCVWFILKWVKKLQINCEDKYFDSPTLSKRKVDRTQVLLVCVFPKELCDSVSSPSAGRNIPELASSHQNTIRIRKDECKHGGEYGGGGMGGGKIGQDVRGLGTARDRIAALECTISNQSALECTNPLHVDSEVGIIIGI